MQLTINQVFPGCADGNYHIRAKNAIAASLHWADENGILPGWSPLACVPVEPNGAACYKMEGGRAVPAEATHVLARAVSQDFSGVEEVLVPIPKPVESIPEERGLRFLVMTDLHLSSKPWQVRKALLKGAGYDAVLITGDMTNDGTKEQLETFFACVQELLPDTPVLAVTGNHDYPAQPLPFVRHGICDYPALQDALLNRAEAMGVPIFRDTSGGWRAVFGDTEILGLNAASHWRRFTFPEGAQLEWLFWQLQESTAKRHIVLCHAPLLHHRPYQGPEDPAYLSRDPVLQRIVDVQKPNIIFLSGHTHVSMNCREGCAEKDARNNFYINCGSIRPTTLKKDEFLQPECWTEGNVVELIMGTRMLTVTGIGMKSAQKISRGHYRFTLEDMP